ncbi:hypothetical protein [Desertivirga xinjiangensis]|uniref:hypothetical protein n=1 Tax=Desertivirga xinjiangensis TaxID=539206 RepID=UPI002109172A|nr:hypothetical protein [Pedobacter xinjiangensis]
MNLSDLTSILKNTTTIGAAKALTQAGVLADQISKSEAYRLFGRSNVDRWVQEGLIHLRSANGKVLYKCIDRSKLEAIAHSSNRITYLPVAER